MDLVSRLPRYSIAQSSGTTLFVIFVPMCAACSLRHRGESRRSVIKYCVVIAKYVVLFNPNQQSLKTLSIAHSSAAFSSSEGRPSPELPDTALQRQHRSERVCRLIWQQANTRADDVVDVLSGSGIPIIAAVGQLRRLPPAILTQDRVRWQQVQPRRLGNGATDAAPTTVRTPTVARPRVVGIVLGIAELSPDRNGVDAFRFAHRPCDVCTSVQQAWVGWNSNAAIWVEDVVPWDLLGAHVSTPTTTLDQDTKPMWARGIGARSIWQLGDAFRWWHRGRRLNDACPHLAAATTAAVRRRPARRPESATCWASKGGTDRR